MVPHLPLPFSLMAVAAPKLKNTALEEDRVVIGASLSDLITIEAANIWGQAFSQPKTFYIE